MLEIHDKKFLDALDAKEHLFCAYARFTFGLVVNI